MTGADSASRPEAARRHRPGYRDAIRAWRWLSIGAFAYAIALAFAIEFNPEPVDIFAPFVGPSIVLMPVFGTPWVVMSLHRRGRIQRAIYLLLLVPLAYAAANYLTYSYETDHYRFVADGRAFERHMLAGAIGGAVGSVLAFAALALTNLVPRRRSTFWFAMWGSLILTAIGSGGMAWGLHWTDPMIPQDSSGKIIVWFTIVHLPWQLAFAAILAAMTRIPPKRRRVPRTARADAGEG